MPANENEWCNTTDWWACMTHLRLQNAEIVFKKHKQHSLRPDSLLGLPSDDDTDSEMKSHGGDRQSATNNDAPT